MCGQCANVRMCKCANCRFKLLRFIACKCFLLRMRGQCANVRMCKCANGRFKLLRFMRANAFCCKGSGMQRRQFAHLHILTFAH